MHRYIINWADNFWDFLVSEAADADMSISDLLKLYVRARPEFKAYHAKVAKQEAKVSTDQDNAQPLGTNVDEQVEEEYGDIWELIKAATRHEYPLDDLFEVLSINMSVSTYSGNDLDEIAMACNEIRHHDGGKHAVWKQLDDLRAAAHAETEAYYAEQKAAYEARKARGEIE